VELLDGFSTRLATMDSARKEIGRAAAEIVARCVAEGRNSCGERVELASTLVPGDTLGVKTIFPAEKG
jgi:LacI family gluconate utilization system Gnt-I transcriptional repressor